MPLMDLSRRIQMKWIKPPVLLIALAPLATLGWKAFHDELGANPIEVITHSTGTWTLVFWCVTLNVTPLRRLLHQGWLVRFRRVFGLLGFFYGALHLTTYVWPDKSFDQRNDPPSGRQTVADASSPCLRQRCCRRDSLLLARKIRRDRTAALRHHRRHSAPLPSASGFPWTYPTKSRARQCRTDISISEVIANDALQLAKDSVDRNFILNDGFLWISSK